MTEIERAREFVDNLEYAEEMIFESVIGLNEGYPIGDAKKKIVGVERNCQIRRLDTSYLTENPYIKNIHIDEWRMANVYLTNQEVYEAYKTYNYSERKRDAKTLTTLYDFCYFKENIPIPSLGTVFPPDKWMGVEPSEINSFSSFIEEASGRVLLMGCGLGYVAYMLSLKEEVEEVTIIELNPYIKKMFETYLKPQMNRKISIFEGDALAFLEHENLSMYSYCSVDIWHGAMDMFPIYLKCLRLEERHPNTKFHYWLEDDLHRAMETLWILLTEQYLNGKLKTTKSDIFMDILKTQPVESIEEIRSFLLSEKRPLIKDWVLNHSREVSEQQDINKSIKTLRGYK